MSVILSLYQVKKLNAMVAEKKACLAPVIKELRQLRQKCQVSRNSSLVNKVRITNKCNLQISVVLYKDMINS